MATCLLICLVICLFTGFSRVQCTVSTWSSFLHMAGSMETDSLIQTCKGKLLVVLVFSSGFLKLVA